MSRCGGPAASWEWELWTGMGGGTKYMNQRDEDFLIAAFQEENYRKEFTDAPSAPRCSNLFLNLKSTLETGEPIMISRFGKYSHRPGRGAA